MMDYFLLILAALLGGAGAVAGMRLGKKKLPPPVPSDPEPLQKQVQFAYEHHLFVRARAKAIREQKEDILSQITHIADARMRRKKLSDFANGQFD